MTCLLAFPKANSDYKSYLGGSQHTWEAPSAFWPKAYGTGANRPDAARGYLERFLGLCWFKVEIMRCAESGMGTALCKAMSFADVFCP
jgi:hypothetical protein